MVNSEEDRLIEDILDRIRTIAIVGLSSKPSRPSNTVSAYLLSVGFNIIPVNPHEKEVFGIPAVGRLEDIDGPVDLVSVFRRPPEGPALARSAAAIGAPAYWMQPGAESEPAAEIARTAGMDVISGPCIMVQHRLLTLRRNANVR
ncbi:MAG: CoA-binding protein [Chloroflexi bacterium]|nr:CoA-binding protein [Chloroflexota bacterium]